MQRRIRELKNDQSGFTLIELLIVIVILGILAAIVVFAVSAFNKNGQQAACQADFKSVQIAEEALLREERRRLCDAQSATRRHRYAGVPAYLDGCADQQRPTRSRSARPAPTRPVRRGWRRRRAPATTDG